MNCCTAESAASSYVCSIAFMIASALAFSNPSMPKPLRTSSVPPESSSSARHQSTSGTTVYASANSGPTFLSKTEEVGFLLHFGPKASYQRLIHTNDRKRDLPRETDCVVEQLLVRANPSGSVSVRGRPITARQFSRELPVAHRFAPSTPRGDNESLNRLSHGAHP